MIELKDLFWFALGHSVGELACAYADGCLTAEEMIMAAYCRGRVSLETKFIRGAMAAIGLGNCEVAYSYVLNNFFLGTVVWAVLVNINQSEVIVL